MYIKGEKSRDEIKTIISLLVNLNVFLRYYYFNTFS